MRRVFRSRRKSGWERRQEGDRARDDQDWQTAEAAFARYLVYQPDDWAIHVQLGHARKEMGNLEGAEASYRNAVTLAEAEADPIFQLAALLERMERREEAVQLYRRSQALGSAEAQRALDQIAQDEARRTERTRRMPHLNHYRVLFADKRNQIWIGTDSSGEFDNIDLKSFTNFRAPAEHHNRYDVVWLFEELLSELPASQWPLVMDEAIRMIGEDGHLIVRHDQDDDFSIMLIRNFLGRRPGIAVTMEPHILEETGIVNAAYRIQRQDIAEYRSKSWSFIILAQGDRTENVLAILDQLRSIGRSIDFEVIIVGPNLEEYSGHDVFVFNKAYRSDYPQIALKKNEAAAFAKGANICILHDRFVLGPDFFDGFDKFGYDFDFVAVRQRYATGEPYPFYAQQSGKPMVWSVPIHAMNYQHYQPTHFVNGGFMVFKRVMFDRIKFNPLLAWNEAEDVEISKAFATLHVPPRINLHSVAVTTVGVEHTSMFLDNTE